MKRRWSSTQITLILLGGFLALMGVEWVWHTLFPPQVKLEAAPKMNPPGIQIGEKAPDFELADGSGKKHRLSKIIRKDALLWFTCGCANCLDLQKHTAALARKMGARAPQVIAVTTMPKAREAAWARDTGLQQLTLFERKGGPVAVEYEAVKCPRGYGLGPDGTIRWISPSPEDPRFVALTKTDLARQLGLRSEGSTPPIPAAEARPASP